jgi:hypothetical protein
MIRPVIGQRYRSLSVNSPNAEWLVEAIYKGMDSLEYAYLRRTSDPAHHKSLVLSVLSDKRRFAVIDIRAQWF